MGLWSFRWCPQTNSSPGSEKRGHSNPDTPASWLEDIQADVASLINPSSDIYETFDPTVGLPVGTTAVEFGAIRPPAINNSASDRFAVQLTAQNIQPGLLENYDGRAKFTSYHQQGALSFPTLTIDTAGLPPSNPYTVSITRKSDGASVVIGTFRVHSDIIRLSALSSATAVPAAEFFSFGHVVFGASVKKSLPTGYDAADVAALTVTDAAGVVRLSGDVADGPRTSELRSLQLHLSGTPVSTGPTANVAVRHHAKLAKTTDRFRLLAKRLPVNVTVTLLADGVVVDHYTTTTHGRLFIIEGFEPQKLNRAGVSPPFNTLRPGTDLSGSQTLTLTDAQGNVLLEGSVNGD